MRIIIICIILAFATFGCKKNEVVPNIDHSSKYYPIAKGYTWIYAVDSIVFYGNLGQNPDTFSYTVKQEVTNTTIDSSGNLSYVVDKSIKREKDLLFRFDKSFGIQKSALELTYNTVDTRLPILTFPLTQDKEWSGNIYTTKDEWNLISGQSNEVECYYESVHQALDIAGNSYDSTSTVIRTKEDNAINSRYSSEIFAANIGLVQKYFENMENFSSNDPKGSIYTYTLISFEK